MTNHFAFGQPSNAIVQMAYLVEDIQTAMADWVRHYNVGPWYLNTDYQGENSVYRGQTDTAVIDVAMAFSGHMQMELIQVTSEGPSIYREAIEKSGHGFHHFGMVADDFDTDLARLQDEGFDLVVTGNVPGTSFGYAYLEKAESFPGYLELIPPGIVPAMMLPIYRASIGWNGKDPIRQMRKK